MTLDGERIAQLQYFLMDAVKRGSVASIGLPSEQLLASAAALDYVLLVGLQHAGEIVDDDAPTAMSVRETVTRAVSAALDVCAAMLLAPDDAFDDFVERDVRRTCVSQLVRELLQQRIVRSGDVAFRNLTLTSEIVERRRRSR